MIRYATVALAIMVIGCDRPTPYKHTDGYAEWYVKFEKMVMTANPKIAPSEVMGLGTAIWIGCDGEWTDAVMVAAIGVAESHYSVKGTMVKYKGYHGAHNGTLLAAYKRAVGRRLTKTDRVSLLKRWHSDRVSATYWSARQYCWLEKIYGPDTLKVWVGGERWVSDPRWNQKAEGYRRMVERIAYDWFGE